MRKKVSVEKYYITKEGEESLKSEYRELFQNERPKLVETVAWAAGNGDRSENADYIYGKKRLREIDRRLHQISDKLSRAEVVDISKIQSERIVFGAKVKVEDESGGVFLYQIVGEDEADIKQSKVSWKSPLGRALIGKKKNDEVLIETPQGERCLIVIDFKFE